MRWWDQCNRKLLDLRLWGRRITAVLTTCWRPDEWCLLFFRGSYYDPGARDGYVYCDYIMFLVGPFRLDVNCDRRHW